MFAAKNELFTRPSGGFVIPRSLRFRASATAYLAKTFGTAPTSGTTQTRSFWFKRGRLTSAQSIWTEYDGGTNAVYLYFNNAFTLTAQVSFGGTGYIIDTNAVFRDPSAWYHIVHVLDSTAATSTNRHILYVNGVLQTLQGSATYVPQNSATNLTGSGRPCEIGVYDDLASQSLDGYMADFYLIDGQALTPSSFGTTSTTTGVWSPKKYTGTYGNHGTHLEFNSYATQAALGTDTSGNSNTFTVNNCSVTAGVTYDSMIDVPTVTDTGSNYAVWNPNDSGLASGSITISQGNLHVVGTGGGDEGVAGSIAIDIGGTTDYVWEIKIAALVASFFGIMPASTSGVDSGRTGQRSYYPSLGQKYSSSTGSAYAASSGAGDVMGFVIGNGSITVYKNGTSLGVMFSGLTDYWKPFMVHNNTYTIDANFGQQGFAYPSSYGSAKALNTYNLAAPSILKGNEYMDATTYTGTGASLSVTNAGGFQPGFVWAKSRSAATDHALYDSVRGTTKQLESNTTSAETTEATGLTAFDSTGFTVGALAQMNTSAATYVGWQWKAGSTVTNTSGTVSAQVSASAASGFSVITYTADATDPITVGHGLGIAPSMYIVKARDVAGTDWFTYHRSIGATKYLKLNTTAAEATATGVWNNTAPTSTVLTTSNTINTNTKLYVVYAFAQIAGYSAFGMYTGNSSSGGPFVYCGFRPKWILQKVYSTTGQWMLWDTTRNTYNVLTNAELVANLTAAEGSNGWGTEIDILSNGFKFRGVDNANFNYTGATYAYAAFAENPFNNSLAR